MSANATALDADDADQCDIAEFRLAWGDISPVLDVLDHRRALAVAASLDGLWEWEFESNALRYSDRGAELLGYAKGEIPNTMEFFWNSLHPDDTDAVRAAIRRCVQDGALTDAEYRLRTKDGEYRWFRGRGLVQRDAAGGATGIAGVLQDITDRKQAEAVAEERLRSLRAALAENESLRARLERENLYLREQVELRHHHGRIIGQSDPLKKVLSEAERVAVTDAPVLLLGETGTGKELLAQTIHELSSRKGRPMVIVNCASLPATLIENELFGREAGAYTGAASAQVGRFVVADGSTLFLDEIGEFPVELQAKLLRVLEDGRFERLGSPKTVSVNVRIIAATNRNLERAVREGTFRADLYHRLNVFPIQVPPLRERREDIPLLTWGFVETIGRRMGKTIRSIPRRTIEQLQRYCWPGNVRELSNVIERAMILTTGDTLRVELPSAAQTAALGRMTLKESQRAQILRVLDETGWRIRGAGGAAEILGLKPTTLEARMAKLGIKREKRNTNGSNIS